MTDLIDVAIRVAQLEDFTLAARKLADNPRALVAAPAYLKPPKTWPVTNVCCGRAITASATNGR